MPKGTQQFSGIPLRNPAFNASRHVVSPTRLSRLKRRIYLFFFSLFIKEPLLTSQDYLNEYRGKHQNNDAYKRMLEQRSQLPVSQYKSALIEAVKNNRVIVVKGATGCGKTTQVC